MIVGESNRYRYAYHLTDRQLSVSGTYIIARVIYRYAYHSLIGNYLYYSQQ